MARARAATQSANAGSRPAGRLSPCRTALREERALPSGVLGPRLRRPFLRLASLLASLIMPAFDIVPILFYSESSLYASKISSPGSRLFRELGCA